MIPISSLMFFSMILFGLNGRRPVLNEYSNYTSLFINQIIYTEISIGFEKIEELEVALSKSGFQMLEIPKEALFLAGKAFLKYRKHKGVKKSPLPDFFIGAQAAVLDLELITRDKHNYQTYFPTVKNYFSGIIELI